MQDNLCVRHHRYCHRISFKNHHFLAGHECGYFLAMETVGKARGADFRLPGYYIDCIIPFWPVCILLELREKDPALVYS